MASQYYKKDSSPLLIILTELVLLFRFPVHDGPSVCPVHPVLDGAHVPKLTAPGCRRSLRVGSLRHDSGCPERPHRHRNGESCVQVRLNFFMELTYNGVYVGTYGRFPMRKSSLFVRDLH